MKILVTGGYGFIGSAVIRRILTETKHEVLNIDSLTYAGNTDSIPQKLKNAKYQFKKVDIL